MTTAPVLGGAAGAGLSVLCLVGLATTDDAHSAPIVVTVTLALAFFPMGLFIVSARRGHLVGRIVLAIGLLSLAAVTASAWSGHPSAAWASQWLWWPPLALIPLALVAFPEGRIPQGARRWMAWAIGVAALISSATLAIAAAAAPTTLLTSAEAAPAAARPWLAAAIGSGLVVLLLTAAVTVDMVRRARADDMEGAVRSQILCLLPAGALLVGGVVLDAAGLRYSLVPAALALPAGMGLAILRHGIDDLDLAVNRTLVWIAMSGVVLATFALMIGLTSTSVLGDSPLLASAIGTGIIAVGFDPLRRIVQRGVDRLLFGDRDRPHEVVQRLGQRMHQASDPGGMLTELVTTLTTALRLPYARMLVGPSGSEAAVVAEWGRAQPGVHSFELITHGVPVGALEVAPRRAGEDFTPAETRLLQQVAAQAAIAAEAHGLTLELQRARAVLVRAREEERLRLRHDLHDGLGPALAGTRMQLSAARGRLQSRPDPDEDEVCAMLSDALDVLAECTTEVRRVVDGLRPAALDRGLAEAVRQRADALLADLVIDLDFPSDLATLPAAVEVATYRILTEAMTNVAKHADARSCRVEIHLDAHHLRLAVVDDGIGSPLRREGGVGLDSMLARAEELGGTCTVRDASPGTRVDAVLPLLGR